MRRYEIYLMEEEVARHYFGQESKLFHLFLEKERASDTTRSIIEKQVNYITRPIPALQLQQLLKQSLKHRIDYYSYKDTHCLSLQPSLSIAEVNLFETKITLEAEGNFDAETIFFEVLRKFDPYFMAIDVKNFRYGWLNPIKQVKLI
ncbi:sporulation inhibitor of replication protein SirA [Desertibacillus haloalkaliphilus]|uniref:sporulation inhibitor of replication protein SirA n=1 Tax=Desertibacillus haloalkaliphilus TaxID=1328930 RepID=UPI001C26A302|nr:sporulation inhibitor of replication protein SirA [Desertibacillus haloalkaliphilus]MBU8907394.1 sporulation inhibitor of replication protein SirA [Desertibacillus haloalkaliphilus]